MNDKRIIVLSVAAVLLAMAGVGLAATQPVAAFVVLGITVVVLVLLASSLRPVVVTAVEDGDDEPPAVKDKRTGGIVAALVAVAGIIYGLNVAVNKYAEQHQEKEIAAANARIDEEEKAAIARGEMPEDGAEVANPASAAMLSGGPGAAGGRPGGFGGFGGRRDGGTTPSANRDGSTTPTFSVTMRNSDGTTRPVTRAFTYDPTNGTVGNGVFRVRQ